MKSHQTLVIFCTFFLISPISTNFLLSTSSNDKKLSNYVCKITKDITKSKSDTQDILIGNLGGKIWSSTVNDIAECVGNGSAVVVSDFKAVMNGKTLRKASIVILMANGINEQIVNLIIHKHDSSTVWHYMANIIVIIPNTHPQNKTNKALELFSDFGFINVAFVHETEDGDIRVETNASLVGRKSSVLNPQNVSLIFPDKLKDMEGFAYQIAVFPQRPRVYIVNGTVLTALAHFMSALEKIQNATVQYIVVLSYKEVVNHWLHRTMHLTLSSGVYMKIPQRELLTYEESGYCALVPLPPKVPLFQSILIEPFDGLTWLFFVLTMACSVAVWSLFRGRGAVDSPWLLPYGMIVMFIGQGIHFSRKNRLVLTILLQLIVLMVWVLSNAYEGIITSFMIQPIQENRLETFEDLVASDYEIMTDEVFALRISGSEAHKVLKPRLNISGTWLGSQFPIELTRKQYVFIISCEQAEVIVDVTLPLVKRKASEFYYLLPQKLLPSLLQLPASYLNPFIERLQYYMDLSFQAGLPHIWNVFMAFKNQYKKGYSQYREARILQLKDLTQIFNILIIGYALSTLVLLIEIFFPDVLKNLKLAYLARKLRNRVHQTAYKKKKQPKHPKYQKGALYYIIHRHKRVKRLQPKRIMVRRIFVQPRFPVDEE